MFSAKYAVAIICFVCSVCFGQSAPQIAVTHNEGQITLSVHLIKSKRTELRYSVELQNNGSTAIYYSATPQQVGGEYGPYTSIDENDKSLLNVQWRVFHPTIVMNTENGGVNKTGVELKRLEPGTTITETVSLKWPIPETMPPHTTFVYRKIERENMKRIRFTVGYFEEEEGIREFLKMKPFGWFIKGHEPLETGIFRGKRLYEIQKLVSAETYVA